MQALELKIPPPVLMVLCVVVMDLVDRFIQLGTFTIPVQTELAVLLGLIGISTMMLGMLAFRGAGTTLDPRRPEQATKLVMHGIFRYTRNPMYLGMAVILLAWGIGLGNGLALVLIPCFMLYLNRFQIRPEERWMRQRFGDQYQQYRADVRRWI